ncbi:uncharacterized protein G2W53_035752 [Senna tora]|uniref:Uncharacterized protein n=1 Tax=Senna tora TaxID=362788 RepID=A0A834T405_9FABA|nr:uncharacterized protein G2W53_035752 [Senna tora]
MDPIQDTKCCFVNPTSNVQTWAKKLKPNLCPTRMSLPYGLFQPMNF